MTTYKQVEKQRQHLERCERDLALEKIKQRRADTRRKIEFGGLVVKSAMDIHNKSIILGALVHALQQIDLDKKYLSFFESIGDTGFLKG